MQVTTIQRGQLVPEGLQFMSTVSDQSGPAQDNYRPTDDALASGIKEALGKAGEGVTLRFLSNGMVSLSASNKISRFFDPDAFDIMLAWLKAK